MARTKTIQSPIALGVEDGSSLACQNPAIARCSEAWERVFRAELAKGSSPSFAQYNANHAYRNALPPLSGYDNICDFIACVAHGMLIGAIQEKNGAKFLYAAQIALGAVRREPKAEEPAA